MKRESNNKKLASLRDKEEDDIVVNRFPSIRSTTIEWSIINPVT